MTKSFYQYFNESINVMQNTPKLPFRLNNLLQLVCNACNVNESSITEYTICDSFSKFIYKFNGDFKAISFNLDSPMLFGNTVTYNTVEDIKKFVDQVIKLIKLLMAYHNKIINEIEGEESIPMFWKKNIIHYNNMAITLNTYSVEFFKLIQNADKVGNCETYKILGVNLSKVFNGDMIIQTIHYNGEFYLHDDLQEI
jgi:hypothetical protein